MTACSKGIVNNVLNVRVCCRISADASGRALPSRLGVVFLCPHLAFRLLQSARQSLRPPPPRALQHAQWCRIQQWLQHLARIPELLGAAPTHILEGDASDARQGGVHPPLCLHALTLCPRSRSRRGQPLPPLLQLVCCAPPALMQSAVSLLKIQDERNHAEAAPALAPTTESLLVVRVGRHPR